MQNDTRGTPAAQAGPELSLEPMQDRSDGEAPECKAQRKMPSKARKQRRAFTKLIVPEALGLSNEDFKSLIAGWIAPRLIAEFAASQLNSLPITPDTNEESALQEIKYAA